MGKNKTVTLSDFELQFEDLNQPKTRGAKMPKTKKTTPKKTPKTKTERVRPIATRANFADWNRPDRKSRREHSKDILIAVLITGITTFTVCQILG